ncbi:MAG: long-chain fatty acid--CoA ligase, partial [Acetobacteraceae bacterium]
ALQFIGRRSDFLNIGGNKRAPHWFEAMLAGHPSVGEVAAFRLPDPGGGDQVGLAVVPGPGFDLQALTGSLAARLGPRYPFTIIEVAAIPFTAAGKTDRRLLALHAQGISKVAPANNLVQEEP